MANMEIDQFVNQFKLLRDAGMESSLNLETKLGEVFISLNCKVGRNLPPPLKSPVVTARKTYRSPSYHRRQLKRKAERESKGTLTLENSLSHIAEEATTDILEEVNVGDEVQREEESIEVKESADDSGTDVEDETIDTERSEEIEEVSEEESVDDLSQQLDRMIRESQNNRNLWEKFSALPP